MADTNAVTNDWTLMFFFASDNELSPLIVSDLKAIKDAGFQLNTTVLAHFDPNELGTPTRIFNINQLRKRDAYESMIGDGRDPYVRNLKKDSAVVIPATPASRSNSKLPTSQSGNGKLSEAEVETALRKFLETGRTSHRAKHYMLFLVGHGMVVGNDNFLTDDNPVSALSLRQLDDILREFATDVRAEGGAFELLGLHSCSMSALEVAYQLKGTANYMIASEGVSYVGGWPYRQMLKKTFNTIEEAAKNGGEVDVHDLVHNLYFLSLYNATDFTFAGYSLDLALCHLETGKVEQLTTPLQNLVAELRRALDDVRGRELILLAHWKSQSYWQESYTDIFDFCKCLRESCDERDELQRSLMGACAQVMSTIEEVVVVSENFGSKYQYSHGLSVYFPWARPVEETTNGMLRRYSEYEFTLALADRSWLSFLNDYFDKTIRCSRNEEDAGITCREVTSESRTRFIEATPGFATARATFNPLGTLAGDKPVPALGDKPVPAMGGACACPPIKNFPEENKEIQGKEKRNVAAFSSTKAVLKAFIE